MSIEKTILNCPFCSKPFQMSHNVYDGRHLPLYQLTACDACYWANRDGWPLQYDAVLLASLEKNGLPVPDRNAKGLLPCD